MRACFLKKKQFVVLIALIIFIVAMSASVVWATHGFGTSIITISVGDRTFEIWGYDGDGSMPAIRLRDVAYILRGTAAQFDIGASPDGFDFYIVRGGIYIPDGTEFAKKDERWAVYGSYGFVGGSGEGGFYTDPLRYIVLGIDGVAVPFLVVDDSDDIFFPLEALGELLGFEVEWEWDYYSSWREIAFTEATTPPAKSTELASLLIRLFGIWVDREFYDSEGINEAVAFPVEFQIYTRGIAESHWAQPFESEWRWGAGNWHIPIINNLEGGFVELIFDGNRRIVVDASKSHIEQATYFVGDESYEMVRFDTTNWQVATASRYQIEFNEDGVILRYIGLLWHFSFNTIGIYRSEVAGERGENLTRQTITDPRDRILFEFIDTTAEAGNTYYYSIWSAGGSVWFDTWQIRVEMPSEKDFAEQVKEHEEAPEPAHEEQSHSWFWWVVSGGIIIIIMGIGGIVYGLRKRA